MIENGDEGRKALRIFVDHCGPINDNFLKTSPFISALSLELAPMVHWFKSDTSRALKLGSKVGHDY